MKKNKSVSIARKVTELRHLLEEAFYRLEKAAVELEFATEKLAKHSAKRRP